MRANSDRVKAVIRAIDEDALRNEEFTFDHFCREQGLYKSGKRERLNDVFIVCPFHTDNSPSLIMSEERRRFKCFGCGKSGSYVHFLAFYDNECLGINSTVEQVVNRILKGNKRIQQKVGFSTIYQNVTNIDSFEKLNFHGFRIKDGVKPMTYLDLATQLKKSGVSNEVIQMAVALMQSGLAPDVIFDSIRREF